MRVILVAAIVLLGAGVRPATTADFRCEAEDKTLKFNLVTLRKKDKLGKPGYYLSVRDKAAPTEFSVDHFGPQEVSAFRYRISDAGFNLTFTLNKPAGEPYGDVTLLIDAPKKETSSKRIDYKGKYSSPSSFPHRPRRKNGSSLKPREKSNAPQPTIICPPTSLARDLRPITIFQGQPDPARQAADHR